MFQRPFQSGMLVIAGPWHRMFQCLFQSGMLVIAGPWIGWLLFFVVYRCLSVCRD